jgi:hypothetical protein
MSGLAILATNPPAHCQYSAGPCDQSFKGQQKTDAFFAFAASPSHLAGTIGAAVEQLTRSKPNHTYLPWTKLQIGGIARSARASGLQTLLWPMLLFSISMFYSKWDMLLVWKSLFVC